MDFDTAFELVIGHEQGFQSNPNDRGNYTPDGRLVGTNFGISARSYPTEDIKGMTLVRAKQIYLHDFWGPAGCAVVPDILKFHLFDFAVNSGPRTAAKALQRSVGAVDDGAIGPKSLLAIGNQNPLVTLILLDAEREELMTNDPTWPKFGKGWIRRLIKNKRMAVRVRGT